MASFNFGLLELADGESGEAAVSVVVGKSKAEAAAAKKAEAAAESAAAAAGSEKEKSAHKNLYFMKLQHDNGINKIEHELKRLRGVLIKLRGEEAKLNEKGQDGGHAIKLPEEQRELRLMQLSEEQRKLRQQQKKLRVEEAKLRPLRKEFYLEHGFPLVGADEEEEPPVPNQAESVQGNDNAGVDNANGSYNGDGNGSVHSYHDGELDVHSDGPYLHHERQIEEGYAYNNNGGRQGYPVKRKVQKYVVKGTQPSSDAGTEADHKPEENVTSDAGSEAEHKPVENGQEEAAAPANADAAPASGSESSSAQGAAASKDGQVRSGPKKFVPKEGMVKLTGSARRKKKNAKKNGGNEVDKASETDVSKKNDKEQQVAYPREEEKKTLAEYEKIREEKKKSSEELSRTEQRKVSAEAFKGLQMLEKKKLDDEEAVMKAEKVQNKAKETSKKEEKPQPEAKDADDGKPKKVSPDAAKPKKVVMPLKELSFAPPRRPYILDEDGSSNGGGAPRGRFNGGGFQGRSRDNINDSRVPAGRGGDNGRAVQNGTGNYGNGAPRGGHSGGRGYGAQRGDYSGGRGDGGYSASRGDYSGGRVDGAQGPYRGRGNGGGYHGNGGSYRNQGGNGGDYQQQQQGGYQRRNDSYYRPRGRGGRHPAPAPEPIVVEDVNVFPPLAASAPARAAAPAAAPSAAPAPASAPAPAQS